MPAARTDLVRARQLLAPETLAQCIGAPGLRLLEIGCGGQAAFRAAHIPGAAYLDTGLLESGPLYNKVADTALLAVLLAHGIGHDSTVILYGRNSLAAARAAHLMLYAGVRDVRLLDGGFDAWRGAGMPTASGAGAASLPLADFGAPFPGRADYLTDLAGARRVLAQDDGVLVSIRTWSEHIGATSGYSYIDACGDIPGARWGRAGREGDVNSMSEYQDAAGRMRSAGAIEQQWRAGGIERQQRIVFYCGTGWRASLAFYYAWLMGWERIGLYDGGWLEWSGDRANPVTRRARPTTPPSGSEHIAAGI